MASMRHRRTGPAWWETQPGQLVGLAAATVVLACCVILEPDYAPLSAFSIIVTVGGFFLRMRTLLILYLLVGSVMYFVMSSVPQPTHPDDRPLLHPGDLAVVSATAALALAYAVSRRDVGLHGRASDSMLLDLRDRLLAQSEIPAMPPQWDVESFFSAAEWHRFSGDFLVASRTRQGFLELALVDVSGKGPAAGARSLSLSGAFSGLLGALPPEQFLPAANQFLLRQNWRDGFATAVHVDLDLATGEYLVRNAGHPPAAQYHLGSGTWELLHNHGGAALGILDDEEYEGLRGVLAPGDALLLYTDGLVEEPGRELSLGIDQLMGEAEAALRDPGGDAAGRIVASMDAAEDDDRSVVVIQRRAPNPGEADGTGELDTVASDTRWLDDVGEPW